MKSKSIERKYDRPNLSKFDSIPPTKLTSSLKEIVNNNPPRNNRNNRYHTKIPQSLRHERFKLKTSRRRVNVLKFFPVTIKENKETPILIQNMRSFRRIREIHMRNPLPQKNYIEMRKTMYRIMIVIISLLCSMQLSKTLKQLALLEPKDLVNDIIVQREGRTELIIVDREQNLGVQSFLIWQKTISDVSAALEKFHESINQQDPVNKNRDQRLFLKDIIDEYDSRM